MMKLVFYKKTNIKVLSNLYLFFNYLINFLNETKICEYIFIE